MGLVMATEKMVRKEKDTRLISANHDEAKKETP